MSLRDFKKAMGVAYNDILNNCDLTWGVKGLIMTRSNLVVTWKDSPASNEYYFLIPTRVALFRLGWLYYEFFVQLIF